MKYMRIGFTETTLLFIHWLEKNKYNVISDDSKSELLQSKKNLINWLCSTSGYYDNNISGSYFDFDAHDVENDIYKEYMYQLSESLMNSDAISFCYHDFNKEISTYKNEFGNRYSPNNYNVCIETLFKVIDNKRVLIISSHAKLVKSQIISGNYKKIYSTVPGGHIIDVVDYTTPYTFFNNGPDGNILETCSKIKNDIKKLKNQFDIAIIGFGAYTCLLAGFIDGELGKDAICLGRLLTYYFGIAAKSFSTENLPNESYWIKNIPDEYKPIGYEKIENGAYW